MEFALTPYDTSKEIVTIKANNFEEWEGQTKDLPFEEYMVTESVDYSWIEAEQGNMEAFFDACEHFEDGLRQSHFDACLLQAAIQETIRSEPQPSDILAIDWDEVEITEKEDLIEHLSDSYDIKKMGALAGYIDWDAFLQDLEMGSDYSSFDYDGCTYYVRGL